MSVRAGKILRRLLWGLSWLLLVGGAAGVVLGTVAPWAAVKVFKTVDLSLPGFVFANGALCLAGAMLVLLGARRSPLLCLTLAVPLLVWAQTGQRSVPQQVKHQLIGAQLSLFPLNRLLDQFHIPDVEVGAYTARDADIIGPGLAWTTEGASAVLLGGLLGLPGDPALVWLWQRFGRIRCRVCGTRRSASRDARYCPTCGVPAGPTGTRLCSRCQTPAHKNDQFCVACGTTL